jgi:hypothetical protein
MTKTRDQVVLFLAAGRRRLIRRTVAAGCLRAGAAGAAILAPSVLTLLAGPPAWAAAIVSAAALVMAVAMTARHMLLPIARIPTLEGFAVRADALLGEGRNLAINALDLGRRLDAEQDSFTRALMDAHVRETAGELSRVDLGGIGRPRHLGRWTALGGIATAVLAAALVAAPAPTLLAARRLLHPSLTEPARIVRFAVEPGDAEVDAGSDLTVTARVEGTRDVPHIRFAAPGAAWAAAAMSGVSEARDARSYTFTFRKMDQDLAYQIAAAGRESDTWTVRVTEPPRVLGYRLTYVYPRYSGLPAETRVAASGDVSALAGTEVTLDIEVNDPESGGYLEIGGARLDLARASDSMGRVASFTVREPRRYRVHLTDRRGRDRFVSPEFAIEPVPDRPPALTVLHPARDIDLPEQMRVALAATAVDDYGLTQIVLQHQVGDRAPVRETIARTSGREWTGTRDWDLSALDLVPGDVVTYHLEVFDNDTVSGPKGTRSDTYSIRFPTVDEMYADLNEEREREIGDLEQVREDQRRLSRQFEEIARQLKKGLEMTWERQKEIENAAREQQAVRQDLERVEKSLEETVAKIEKNDLANLDMVEKLQEIQDLLSQVQNEELKDALRKLSEAMQKMNRNDVQRSLEQMKGAQEDLMKSLDRTIEMLKRIRMEERLAQTVERVTEMLERQERINDALERSPRPETMDDLAKREEEISRDHGGTEEDLRRLAQESRTDHPQMAEALEQALSQQDFEATREAMESARKEMSQRNASKAGQQGRQAKAGLESLLQGLEQAQSQMSEQLTAELAEKLTRIQNDLLRVSESQEQILGEKEETPVGDLAERQTYLEEAARRSADSLFAVSKQTRFVTPQLGRMMGSAIEELARAKKEFAAGNRRGGMERARESRTTLNETVLALMQQNQSMCQNPGSSGMSPSMSQMQQLGQQQERLNADARSLAQQIRQRLSSAAGQEELSRLAAQQEMIRKGLEEVSGELGERSDILGRLDQIAQEMGEIAKRIQREGLPEDVLRRQDKVLTRLLDAQKSVRKQDHSRRRRSETGTDVTRVSPGALPPDLLSGRDRLQSDILRGAADPYPAEYRRLVEQYFRSLTSGAAGGGR